MNSVEHNYNGMKFYIFSFFATNCLDHSVISSGGSSFNPILSTVHSSGKNCNNNNNSGHGSVNYHRMESCPCPSKKSTDQLSSPMTTHQYHHHVIFPSSSLSCQLNCHSKNSSKKSSSNSFLVHTCE